MFYGHTELPREGPWEKVLPNIWSGSSHTNRGELMQCPSCGIWPHREFGVDDEIVEPVGRTSGIIDYTTGRVLAKTCPEIQQEREDKGV